jgi:hypothetical protein
MFGYMSVIIYFVYILCHFSSCLINLGSFFHFFDIIYTMFYYTLCMTLNYFKSFFIIEEMKWKIWDITFVKYLKMWRSFWNQWYHLLEVTYAFFTTIFSLDVLFKDNKHITLLTQKHILVQKTFSSYKIYLFVHHNLKEPCLQRLVNLSCQVL